MANYAALVADLYRGANEIGILTLSDKTRLLSRATAAIEQLRAAGHKVDDRLHEVDTLLPQLETLYKNISGTPDDKLSQIMLVSAELIRVLNIFIQ